MSPKHYSPSHMIQFFKYICKTQVHCAMVITLKKTHLSVLLIYNVQCIIILCITKANIKWKVNVLSN